MFLCGRQNHNINIASKSSEKCQNSNIWRNTNTWKLHAYRISEQIKSEGCLLPFSVESFVFLSPMWHKGYNIWKSSFACCFVRVCILVSHNERRENRLWCFEKREEVTGGWRKFHNEQFHDLCSSANIIRVFRLRRKRRVGHVGCM